MDGVRPEFARVTGKVHEALMKLEKAGLTDGGLQRIVEDQRLAEAVVRLVQRGFSPKTRSALVRAGFEIVEVPAIEGGITLNWLYRNFGNFDYRGISPKFLAKWHGDFTRSDIESIPLPAGEYAWMPKDPLIPDSLDKTFPECQELVEKYDREVQERFGARAIFPTAEHLYLLFDHYRRTGEYVLSDRWTWTLNRRGSYRLDFGGFGSGGVGVGHWDSSFRYWYLGVLRLVVPRI